MIHFSMDGSVPKENLCDLSFILRPNIAVSKQHELGRESATSDSLPDVWICIAPRSGTSKFVIVEKLNALHVATQRDTYKGMSHLMPAFIGNAI
ncbi:hypothetical protein B0G80_7395 [Paraburkholderia sp. BL6669N2]|nr:hypothetical protein B0G80_7395 [Paraburkholderia sp. BL6669N2]